MSLLAACSEVVVLQSQQRRAFLKETGLINDARGQIQILDVPELRKTACECDTVIKHPLNT